MMKNISRTVVALLLQATLCGTPTAHAQIREIPPVVMETFTSQYPGATQTRFIDQLVRIDVRFLMDSSQYLASYSNKGLWKGTERKMTLDSLSEDVRDGWQKSKYADWNLAELTELFLPGGTSQIRLRVDGTGIQKRYLFFNLKGQLIRDSFTL